MTKSVFSEISATDFQRDWGKYVKRIEAGESFAVTSHGSVVFHVGPPPDEPVTLPPATWEPSPSAGTAGSPVAADGRRHWRNYPCPSGLRYRLSDDARIWLLDYPPINLKTAERVLSAAFPQRRR